MQAQPAAKPDTGNRFASMFLDYMIMTFVAVLIMLPGMAMRIAQMLEVGHGNDEFDLFGGNAYVALLGFALYFCKDCINGRSLAKRIMKLQVVDAKTLLPASPLQTLVRNATAPLWFIEGIVALVNPSRRLGDRIAGIKLVTFAPQQGEAKPNFVQVGLALAIAYAFCLLLWWPFHFITANYLKNKNRFVPASYNERTSKEIEKQLADSLQAFLQPDVRMYDKMEEGDTKYLSCIYTLNETFFDDPANANKVSATTRRILEERYPDKKLLARIKYVTKTESGIQINYAYIDLRKPPVAPKE
jgi:uncharacterized RDD family membrane protein YckC